MARALSLDLSDGGLLGVAEGGAVLGPSPGCALVEGDVPLFGEEALRRSRLSPRLVASDFWSRLDPAPLGPPFPDGLSAADLVHGHLESLWRTGRAGTDEVVLAVPGVYDERQLGLLLGIAQALSMPVTGLVDAAVAAASAGFPGERLLHVDLGLRRAVVTEIRQGASLVRERVARLDRWGLDEVHDVEMRGSRRRLRAAVAVRPAPRCRDRAGPLRPAAGLARGARAGRARDVAPAVRGGGGDDRGHALRGGGLDGPLRRGAVAAGERLQARGRAPDRPRLGARRPAARPRRTAGRGPRGGGRAPAGAGRGGGRPAREGRGALAGRGHPPRDAAAASPGPGGHGRRGGGDPPARREAPSPPRSRAPAHPRPPRPRGAGDHRGAARAGDGAALARALAAARGGDGGHLARPLPALRVGGKRSSSRT